MLSFYIYIRMMNRPQGIKSRARPKRFCLSNDSFWNLFPGANFDKFHPRNGFDGAGPEKWQNLPWNAQTGNICMIIEGESPNGITRDTDIRIRMCVCVYIYIGWKPFPTCNNERRKDRDWYQWHISWSRHSEKRELFNQLISEDDIEIFSVSSLMLEYKVRIFNGIDPDFPIFGKCRNWGFPDKPHNPRLKSVFLRR